MPLGTSRKKATMTHHELITLFNPPITLKVFSTVVNERGTRFKDLLNALEPVKLNRDEIRDSLVQLEEANLIESQDAPEGVEDFRWYYVTEEGLSAERELRRLELVG